MKRQEGAPSHYTEEMPFIPNTVLVNFQQAHATAGDAPSGFTKPAGWQSEWYFNATNSANMPAAHSINALQQRGH